MIGTEIITVFYGADDIPCSSGTELLSGQVSPFFLSYETLQSLIARSALIPLDCYYMIDNEGLIENSCPGQDTWCRT